MLLGSSLLARILELLRWQGVVGVSCLALAAWGLKVLWRARWSPSRNRLLSAQLRALRDAVLVAAAAWAGAQGLVYAGASSALVVSVGFVAVVAWLHVALRAARVCVLAWLFANSEREGVPLLLVDIFTLVASAVLFGALLHAVFLIEVTSLLATSAVLSVVLGLALQDTLGQLFAGISLQLDRPFRLGDWVEVRFGAERVGGQVLEVSWRATLLLAISEELITIPNKTMAAGLVSNFSGRERPFVRGHLFRLPLDVDLPLAKRLLLQAALETEGVVSTPAPVPLVIETTESWVAVKMINFVADYGNQFTIGDAYQARALALLAAHGIALAGPRLSLSGSVAPPR
mgnify:CR=1 FL=1